MNGAEHNPEDTATGKTVLDDYFALAKRDPAYRKKIAMRIWRTWPPDAQLRQQLMAQQISGGNLALSESYTQAMLLLEYVNQKAIARQRISKSVEAYETIEPTAFGDDASNPQLAV